MYNFEVPQFWPSTGTRKFFIIKCMVMKDFQNYFSTKSYSSVSQNIKMQNGLIARKAKVLRCPKFVLILDFLGLTVWAKKKKKKKKKNENIVLIQSYMYDFVTIFKKVCLGLIAPKFEVPQSWPSTGTCYFHIIKCMVKKDFQN